MLTTSSAYRQNMPSFFNIAVRFDPMLEVSPNACCRQKTWSALLTSRQNRSQSRGGICRELKDAIHRFLDDTNANPKPFTWTKDPNKIIAAVKRGHQVLDSIH